MNHIKKKDLQMGYHFERELLPLLRKHTKDNTLYLIEDKYSTFDYRNEKGTIFAELKSRNCLHDKYPTTMIGANKVLSALFIDNCYFYFRFFDGIYFWKFNDAELKHFERKRGGRRDRGIVEENDYYFIPIEYLTII